MVVEDLLEGDLAMQLGIQRHEDGAEAAPGVGPQDAEALAVGGGGADSVAGGPVGFGAGAGGELAQGLLDVGVGEGGKRLAGGPPGGDGGEALLGVAAVLLQVQPDHGLDAGALVGVEVATGGEVLGQGPGLVAGPGLEGGDELDLVDQAVLQGEQAEEQVVVGGDGGHGAGLPGCRHGRWAFSPDVGGLRPRGAGSVGLSHAGSAHAAPPRPLGLSALRLGQVRPSGAESELLNWRTEFLLCWGLRPGLRTASRVAHVGPTHEASSTQFRAWVDRTERAENTLDGTLAAYGCPSNQGRRLPTPDMESMRLQLHRLNLPAFYPDLERQGGSTAIGVLLRWREPWPGSSVLSGEPFIVDRI